MKVQVDLLRQCAAEILKKLGETDENAGIIADSLVKADMRGISTHGTYLLKVIRMRTKGKQLTLPTNTRVVSDSGATAVIDGMDGIGMVAGYEAAKIAVGKAKLFGIGIVLVRNTNNIGSMAFYTQFGAEQGMVMIMASNAAPAMAPWGGAEKFMGTNPIAISFPSIGYCFTTDMATSVVARGKIRKAARQGTSIPNNWALDSEGMATDDPNRALQGTLLPIGGPKGSALALAVDVLSGLLAGSSYGPLLKSFHELEGPTGVGVSCIAIDISHFMEIDKFKELTAQYAVSLKNMKKAEGFDEILMPGEIEDRREKEGMRAGIELEQKQIAELNEILAQVGSDLRI